MALPTFPVVLYFSDLYLGEGVWTLDVTARVSCLFGGGRGVAHIIEHFCTKRIHLRNSTVSAIVFRHHTTGSQRSEVFTQ